MSQINTEIDLINNNKEEELDLLISDLSGIVMFSRDWTVSTIFEQIKEGNIELNPRFQRRNAWKDSRRSRLIESIIIGYPIPEIVLAQDPKEKGKFIVIDGKQRLLTIAGFIDNGYYKYWDKEELRDLKVRADLNGTAYKNLSASDLRCFKNTSLRCTVVANFKDSDILYDIFYRLNVGTVQLATQELRQVLNKGEFANYLFDYTDKPNPIWKIMDITEPDTRMRDIEVLLRLIVFILYPSEYKGNLKYFLDEKMQFVNDNWATKKEEIEKTTAKIESAIDRLHSIMGDYKKIAQRPTDERRKLFNRVLFEVLVFYFAQIDRKITEKEKNAFNDKYINMFKNDEEFLHSLDTTTKSLENYKIRYGSMKKLMVDVFKDIEFINPYEES